MENTPKDKMTEDFYSLLQVPPIPDESKRGRILQSRLVGLGFGMVCSRCGGCGQYSYCPMYGTTCFKCGGSGFVAQRLTKTLYNKVAAVVPTALAPYLEETRKKGLLRKVAKEGPDKVMKAWQASGVSEAYSWMAAANNVPHDRYVADTFNRPMYDAHDRVYKLSSQVDSLRYAKVTTPEERAERDAKAETLVKEAAAATEEALSLIATLTAELKAYLASREKEEGQ